MGGNGGTGKTQKGSGNRGAERTKFSCEDLMIETQLKSPIEDVVITLKVGDTLQILISPPDSCIAVFNGKQAGKIVCAELRQLLECLEKGNRYWAVVQSINGVRCSIRITN